MSIVEVAGNGSEMGHVATSLRTKVELMPDRGHKRTHHNTTSASTPPNLSVQAPILNFSSLNTSSGNAVVLSVGPNHSFSLHPLPIVIVQARRRLYSETWYVEPDVFGLLSLASGYEKHCTRYMATNEKI